MGGGQCEACHEKSEGSLQRAAVSRDEQPQGVPPIVHEVLSSPGQPLDAATRSYFEPRFGHDFSRVRVHTDAKAAASAKAVHARAFTQGSDIVFAGSGALRDQNTLAHELTHVVQQSLGPTSTPHGLEVSPSNTAHEAEADRTARNVLSSGHASDSVMSAAPSSLQRQGNEAPPHKLVPLSTDPAEKHKASDAVVGDFQAAAEIIQAETGVDLTKGPGDTVRGMSEKTEKPGASNFSWHKTGRAIDINQNLKWVIVNEPAADGMKFRIYLEKTKTMIGQSRHERTFTKEEKPDFSVNPHGNNVFQKTYIDVTETLTDHGFTRIPAQEGWEHTRDKREWWHYEKRDAHTMYEALRDIHTADEVVKGYKSLVTDEKSGQAPTKSLVRLHKEGFPYETIQNISPKTPNAERQIELSVAKDALNKNDHDTGALYLNRLNEPDIKRELKNLLPEDIKKIHESAICSPALSAGSNIAKLTKIPDVKDEEIKCPSAAAP
jgi:hypothetical protein